VVQKILLAQPGFAILGLFIVVHFFLVGPMVASLMPSPNILLVSRRRKMVSLPTACSEQA
jgi:hypothetical protein